MKLSALTATFLLPGFAALCLWAVTAQANPAAAEPEGAPKVDKFTQMDADKDGKVSYEEFKAFFPSMREEAFMVIDKDGDKYIERLEWDEFVKNHASGHMGGKMGNMMDGANSMTGNPMLPSPNSSDLPLVTPPNGN
jgi:hypothetical protein